MFNLKVLTYAGKEFFGKRETLSELEAWRDKHIAKDTWGKKERSIVKGSEDYPEELFLEEYIDNTDPINPVIMIKLAQEYTIGEIEDLTPQVTIKNAAIQADKNIRAIAEEFTGMKGDSSQLATTSSWQLRVKYPEKYLEANLVAHKDYGSFLKGDALDNVDKIEEYYSNLLVDLDIAREAEKLKYYAIKQANS